MKYSISTILTRKFPGREWSISDEDYKKLNILDDLPKPTMDELIAADLELQKLSYIEDREAAYIQRGVTLQNLSVALWEQIVENRPDSANALQTIRLKVKSDFPKPT